MQIFTGEVSLAELDILAFVKAVENLAKGVTVLNKPASPECSEDLWLLLQRCWSEIATDRPSIDLIVQVLDGAPLPEAFRSPKDLLTATCVPAENLSAEDVEAILAAKATGLSLELHWQSSIVDLLKLLGLNSGLVGRGKLGEKLGVHEGPTGSARQNIALHAAVMRNLAENGGCVTDFLRI